MMERYRIAINRLALEGKLPMGDPRWAKFNDGFDNLTLEPMEIADAIYRGFSFTTWHTGRRALANFICGQHVAIDMDTEDERSTIDGLSAHPWVRMYASMVYTTPSHTEDKPRARVLFLLDEPIDDANAYGEIVQFVMSQFDEPDTACKDASRFFYGSIDCHLRIFDNVLPVAHLRRLYAKHRRHAPKTTQPTPRYETDENGKVINLEAERTKRRVAALTGETPDELGKAIEALSKFDAYDVDYNKWVGVIKTMRDEFGDAAFSAVEQWAKGKPGEVRAIWEKQGQPSKSATLGTIFYLAAGKR
jgi:hypothetical protein